MWLVRSILKNHTKASSQGKNPLLQLAFGTSRWCILHGGNNKITRFFSRCLCKSKPLLYLRVYVDTRNKLNYNSHTKHLRLAFTHVAC